MLEGSWRLWRVFVKDLGSCGVSDGTEGQRYIVSFLEVVEGFVKDHGPGGSLEVLEGTHIVEGSWGLWRVFDKGQRSWRVPEGTRDQKYHGGFLKVVEGLCQGPWFWRVSVGTVGHTHCGGFLVVAEGLWQGPMVLEGP